MPSVIAGDTGIPSRSARKAFYWFPAIPTSWPEASGPSDAEPTLVTENGKAFIALSTPGGDNQEQSLVQVLFDVIEFGMNAQAAVEAPRFQTRHLVSSFDNHAMSPATCCSTSASHQGSRWSWPSAGIRSAAARDGRVAPLPC